MILNQKLNVIEAIVPGDFGFNYKLPLWLDQIELGDVNDVYTFIQSNFYNIKVYDLDEVFPEGYLGWKDYNIFTYDIASLGKIKAQILERYLQFCNAYKVEPLKEVWINGWLNVMEPGKQIRIHKHSMHENSYLSGVIHFSENDSTTDMYPPQLDRMEEIGTIKIPNNVGSLIFFPQWLYHSVSPVTENLRISLGFDLHPTSAIEYYNKYNSNIDMPIKRAIRLI
jgi:hypothetical protein